ncbi:ROK family protein [Dietzia alimentaria]|uniref:ROK family protein n=1 Tax=Dietzia alimentaria TaxID=665550 RepID=UPI00029B4EE0|nr:ROK family protein [Dietzia alimentaria]
MRNGVVVDMGGSGTRIGAVVNGNVVGVHSAQVSTAEDLAAAILAVDSSPAGVGVSINGRVDADKGQVLASRAAAWAEGGLRSELVSLIDAPVSVIGDGDAHALALTRLPDVTHGGIAISLGASLSFGALNHHGALIHPCGHTGWDLGHWRLTGDGTNTEVWWALGGHGLYDLEREHGDGAPEIYAYRLGSFLVDAVQLFRPRTVLLTGGIVVGLGEALHGPVAEQLGGLPLSVTTPRVVYSPSRDTALFGAAVAAGLALPETR